MTIVYTQGGKKNGLSLKESYHCAIKKTFKKEGKISREKRVFVCASVCTVMEHVQKLNCLLCLGNEKKG